MTGRDLFLSAHLLDRQLIDREGVRCGKVDDLELTLDDTGSLTISAVVCGPGALLTRTGHTRLGRWLRRLVPALTDGHDPGRIPVRNVAQIGNHVTLSLTAAELATHLTERWTLDHVIAHLPGGGRRAGQ
jgi:hypothetical protein